MMGRLLSARSLVAITVLALILVVVGWLRRGAEPDRVLRPVPFTSYPGSERDASFSPAGDRVAFSWDGNNQNNYDIYIKLMGTGNPLRLTDHPAVDFNPAWSPDGRQIAFLRELPTGNARIFLVSALGGTERDLGELNVLDWLHPRFLTLCWTQDNRRLVISDRDSTTGAYGLSLLSVETGERRRLTSPDAETLGDFHPSLSPDGRSLAFTRHAGVGAGDLYRLKLTSGIEPGGEPERLTFDHRHTVFPAWTAEGSEIVFASGTTENLSLWRIRPPRGTPLPLVFASEGASRPAVSYRAARLIYTRFQGDTNIWRIEREGADGGVTRQAFISSSRTEFNPQFSPDGERIAFYSDRSGHPEIWVCDRDGSNQMQLTSLGGSPAGTPRWSPDGEWIAFDCTEPGQREIYLIRARGGQHRRLTNSLSHEAAPSWSRDGKWVYFASNRGGDFQIWRMPVSGGEAVQVTHNGGYVAFESMDGESIYYTKPTGIPGGLWQLALGGDEEVRVLETVSARAFVVFEQGIYYISGEETDRSAFVMFFGFENRTSTPIAEINRPRALGLAVAPDGRTILYAQSDLAGADLMLVEGFR